MIIIPSGPVLYYPHAGGSFSALAGSDLSHLNGLYGGGFIPGAGLGTGIRPIGPVPVAGGIRPGGPFAGPGFQQFDPVSDDSAAANTKPAEVGKLLISPFLFL